MDVPCGERFSGLLNVVRAVVTAVRATSAQQPDDIMQPSLDLTCTHPLLHVGIQCRAHPHYPRPLHHPRALGYQKDQQAV